MSSKVPESVVVTVQDRFRDAAAAFEKNLNGVAKAVSMAAQAYQEAQRKLGVMEEACRWLEGLEGVNAAYMQSALKDFRGKLARIGQDLAAMQGVRQ